MAFFGSKAVGLDVNGFFRSSSTSIEVDPELMADLAWELKQSYEALSGAGAARLAHCAAGDRKERVQEAVAEYVELNQTARERVVEKLRFAHGAANAAAEGFGGVESSHVAALNGKES